MPAYHIWFVKDKSLHKSNFGMWRQGVGEGPKFPDDYELAARVEAPNFESCFGIAQNIDEPWKNREEVKTARQGQLRSMAVDDIVTLGIWNEDCCIWIAKPIGWERIR